MVEHTQDGWPPRGATCSWCRVTTDQVGKGGKCNLGKWPLDCLSRGHDLKSGVGGKWRDMWYVGPFYTFTQGSLFLAHVWGCRTAERGVCVPVSYPPFSHLSLLRHMVLLLCVCVFVCPSVGMCNLVGMWRPEGHVRYPTCSTPLPLTPLRQHLSLELGCQPASPSDHPASASPS